MIKVFLKYCLLVSLLISGSASQIYGNTVSDRALSLAQEEHHSFDTDHSPVIHAPAHSSQRRNWLFEITEVEETEDEDKVLKRTFEVRSFLAAYLRDQLLKSLFFESRERKALPDQYAPASFPPRRHVMFEVFLI